MNKKKILRIIVTAMAIVIVVFLLRRYTSSQLVSSDSNYREIMSTFARVVVVADNLDIAKKCIDSAFEQFESVDSLMNIYREDSQLWQVNKEAFTKPVKVSDDLFEVLNAAVNYSKMTDGAFDVTVGPLVDLWKSAGKNGTKPTDQQINEAAQKTGYKKLILDTEQKTVRFAVEGMKLDLGGIAKGYAIDRAVEVLKQNGAAGAMVDIGGDIRCFGRARFPNKNWVIGLQDPEKEDILLKMKVPNMAVATSGDYRRFILIDSQKYSHIINPSKGTSAGKLSSVTIIAPKAIDADALATSVTVMGLDSGLKLIESIPQAEAILIPKDHQEEMKMTTGMPFYLEY